MKILITGASGFIGFHLCRELLKKNCQVIGIDNFNSYYDPKLKEERYKKFVELNVQEQCVNVIKTADVQKAIRKRTLSVHGWVFDIHSGKLIDLKIDFDAILENIMEIYRLDD